MMRSGEGEQDCLRKGTAGAPSRIDYKH